MTIPDRLTFEVQAEDPAGRRNAYRIVVSSGDGRTYYSGVLTLAIATQWVGEAQRRVLARMRDGRDDEMFRGFGR